MTAHEQTMREAVDLGMDGFVADARKKTNKMNRGQMVEEIAERARSQAELAEHLYRKSDELGTMRTRFDDLRREYGELTHQLSVERERSKDALELSKREGRTVDALTDLTLQIQHLVNRRR